MQNPFQYQRPLPPAQMIDREPELAELRRLCDAGQLVRLDAPRRFGKTTLLAALFADAEKDGTLGVLVDLAGVVSVAEVVERLARAYRVLSGPVARRVSDFLATLGLDLGPVRVELARRDESEQARLLRLLDAPQQIARRGVNRVIVAFDEFQEVLKIGGLDGTIRSQIQHHDEYVAYVFAGSEPELMRRLFAERGRPFWDQAEPVALGRLEADAVAAYVGARFRETGRDAGAALQPLLAAGAGHPQRSMLLANRLWELTPRGATADETTFRRALEAAMLRLAESFGAQWRGLDANAQRAARAIALSGGQPYRQAVIAYVGMKRGSLPGALERLAGSGVAERLGTGSYRFVDPLFERWVGGDQRLLEVADAITIAEMPG